MMTIEAKAHHCGRISRLLRGSQMEMLAKAGIDSHRFMRDIFDRSYYRRACFIDGELMFVGGAEGSVLSPFAFVWAAVSRGAQRHKIAVARELKRCMEEIASTKHMLQTTVVGDDETSLRLIAFLGFHTAPQEDGQGKRAWSAPGRRALVDFVRRTPDLYENITPSLTAVPFFYTHEATP